MAILKLPTGTAPRERPLPPEPHSPEEVAHRWLIEAYPALFKVAEPVPLAIGLRIELTKIRPSETSHTGIRRALRTWCNCPAYLAAVARGGARHGLNGPAGTVTHAEQRRAVGQLQPGETPAGRGQ